MDKRLVVISLILFVNDLGVGLILPLLPFMAVSLGATPLIVGLFLSTLPFFSILAGPPLGVLSDKYGRKPVLLVSVAGTVAGSLLLGVARTLPLLFLARIIDGASAWRLISKLAWESEQGNVIGTASSAISAASVIAPVFATSVFSLSVRGVYVSASVIAVVAVIVSTRGIETAT